MSLNISLMKNSQFNFKQEKASNLNIETSNLSTITMFKADSIKPQNYIPNNTGIEADGEQKNGI